MNKLLGLLGLWMAAAPAWGARRSFDASLLEAHIKRRRFWLAGVRNP